MLTQRLANTLMEVFPCQLNQTISSFFSDARNLLSLVEDMFLPVLVGRKEDHNRDGVVRLQI